MWTLTLWWMEAWKITHSAGNNLKYISEPGSCVPNKWVRICHCFVSIHVSVSMLASALTYHTWCLIAQGQDCQQPLLTTLHLLQSILLHIQYMYQVDAAPQVKAKVRVIVLMQSLYDLSSSVVWTDVKGHFHINNFWSTIGADWRANVHTRCVSGVLFWTLSDLVLC